MAKTSKTLDLNSIETRRQAMKALKDLGFNEPGYVMTRGTKLLEGYDLSISLAPENFMVMDRRSELTFIPMLVVIKNTAESAGTQLAGIFEQLVAKGIVPAGTTQLPLMGLAVGIAMLGIKRQSAAA